MLLRILTDPRVSVDPARAGEIPATMVLALNDALDLRDEAERRAMDRS